METKENVGEIDILINNAGVEFTSFFHDLSEEDIKSVLGVNLEAPMILTKLVLPDMLQRNRGHIVNISSLAGKVGPAFQEPYAATKAGLIAFTASLRATYDGSGVSASVICPGFVSESGMFAKYNKKPPWISNATTPDKVAKAVIRAIKKNVGEIVVNPGPAWLIPFLDAIHPAMATWLYKIGGVYDFYRGQARDNEMTQKKA